MPPVQMMNLSVRSCSPASVTMVCGSAKRAVPACSWTVTPRASIHWCTAICARTSSTTSRTRASKPGIIQHRLAHGDAVLTQLPSFAYQPGGLGQGPHRNWSVVGCHAAKFTARYQRGARAQVRRAEGGEHTRRSSADNDHVHLI
jgi:hypothetical protein